MDKSFPYLFFTAVFFCDFNHAEEKHWLPDFEWQTASNWIEGHPPDPDSLVVFPAEMRHAAGMPEAGDSKLAALELSRDGALVLPRDGKLEISGIDKSKGKIATWSKEGPFYWADPLNWNTTSEAVPDLERVPCLRDVVVLPASNRTLSINLPTTSIEVKAVKTADERHPFSKLEWWSMKNKSEFSSAHFDIRYSYLFNCDHCICQHENQLDYLIEVCNIQQQRCRLPACEYPLQVEGHCCFYCGGRVKLSHHAMLPTVQRIAKEALQEYEDTISWYARQTWDGAVEVLVTERKRYAGLRSEIAVADLESLFKDEGVEVMYIQTSGGALHDHRLAMTIIPFFGGLLFILVTLLILFPAFGYSYRQVFGACREFWNSINSSTSTQRGKSKSYGFARFENVQEGSIQLSDEMKRRASVEEDPRYSATGGSFENPLFQTKKDVKDNEERLPTLDVNEPVSLTALKRSLETDRPEEIEMDIEKL